MDNKPLGQVGNRLFNFQGKQVLSLEYEAYEEMALKKLGEVREELQAQFDLEHIAIAHRIGTVPIGEISLVVAVASPPAFSRPYDRN